MSSPYVGRSLSTTRSDGKCGGTPFVLVGSCVAARYDRQVRAAWSCVHSSKTSLKKFKGRVLCMHFCTRRGQHVHDEDENTSRPRSLDSSPRALASLSNYTRLVRTDMSPFERPLRPRGTAATTRPTPRAPAAFGGWRSSATPRTAAWLLLERLVEGLRQCVSRYHI